MGCAMSFDIFLIKFENKEVIKFKRSIFEDIFGPYVAHRESGFMRLVYSDQGGADIFIQDGDEIGGAMFNHCGGEAFWQGLYELMARAGVAVFWADLPPCCAIPNEAMLEELSADFLDTVKTPSVVSSGHEIVEAIGRS